MLQSLVRSAGAIFAASLLALPHAQAQPIVYTFSGLATGYYGASAFTDAAFSFAFTADLGMPYITTSGGYAISGLPSVVNVGSVIVGGSFDRPLDLFVNNALESVGFTGLGGYFILYPAGYPLIGNHGPPRSPLGTYDLQGPLSPVGGTVDGGIPTTVVNGAWLEINGLSDVTFSAALGPAAVTTPEPAAIVLLGTGLLAVGLVRHRRRQL